MIERLQRWFDALDDHGRRQMHGLALCMAIYLVHYTVYSFWYIEDAAISFAFAHHAVMGEGFVAFPGGERVEGFSNPTWTMLLALFDLVGVNPWISAKLMGAVFGLVTLPVAWGWACFALERGDEPAQKRLWPLLAPLILACSPQFVLWNASGLENSLFNLFLALGAWATLREARDGTAPLSALAWAGLAMTRPEAPLYAAVAGILGFGFVVHQQGAKRGVVWAVVWNALFAVTFGVWFLWRYLYFAWPFPNTYYAKVPDDGDLRPPRWEGMGWEGFKAWVDGYERGWYYIRTFVDWDGKGWKYVRKYSLFTGHGFLLPIYALGQTSLMGGRGNVGIALSLAGVALVAPGLAFAGGEDEPWWWIVSRVLFLALAVVVLPLVGIGRKGHPARVLAWFLAAVGVFFALYSGGDWMRGFRWFSMPSVPMAVLFADAAMMIHDEVYDPDDAPGWRKRVTLWLPRGVAAYPVIAGLITAGIWLGRPETTPYDVKRRVDYMKSAAERLHLDHVKLLEVDMGAHMWWSGFRLVDIAGLIDVPMAHHEWGIPFVRQYVYEEQQPDFAHVHPSGGWGSRTKMRVHKGWREFVQIPAYPVSPRMQHIGNNVRRDLFMEPAWSGLGGRAMRFTEVVSTRRQTVATLMGWELPAPEVVAGQELFVEVGLQRGRKQQNFRVHAFLTDGERLKVWEIPPAYDWLEIKKWKRREVAHNRHSLRIPDDWPTGSYDLGFAVFGTDDNGRAFRATNPADEPVYVDGEFRIEAAVTLVPEAKALELADQRLQNATDMAQQGHCEAAEQQWQAGRRHLDREHAWQGPARETIDMQLSVCFAERALAAGTDAEAAEAIAIARLWDHWPDRTLEVGAALADRWEAAGDEAHASGDDEAAYTAWARALTADPSRAWVRKRAEAARDRWLAAVEEEEEAEKERKRKKSRAQRNKMRDQRERAAREDRK